MKCLRISFFLLVCFLAACGTAGGPATERADSATGTGAPAGSNPASIENAVDKDRNDVIELSKVSVESIYTDLAEDTCVDKELDESEEWSVQSCKGVSGYSLLVSEGDARQSIEVVAPDKQKFKLEFWTVVSSGFSTVGDKAEWRVVKENGKIRPIALIVRYNVSEDPDNSEKITSYLTVSKITSSGACVTDIVKPVKYANNLARKLADVSPGKPCLKKSPQ